MPDPYSTDYTGTPLNAEQSRAFKAQDARNQARQQDAYMARKLAEVSGRSGARARKNTRK